MRAYWAVIKDAFRAAMAAKLLYVMFVLIVLFLLVLAPLSYRETLSSTLREIDVRNVPAIAQRLYEASQSDEPSAEQYLWGKLSERTQELATDYLKPEGESDAPGEQFNRINQLDFLRQALHRDFRRLIGESDFFDETALADLELDEEARELADKGVPALTADQSKRLNRLVLDSLFPLELANSSSTMLRFTYLGFAPPLDDFALSRRELDLLSTTTIPWILDKVVLSIGVLVAILFTANMVPELLEPGSLNLLLSKPVRRWGLFLSKYLGACVFSLLNATLLFAGLWLILGARLGIWNVAFLDVHSHLRLRLRDLLQCLGVHRTDVSQRNSERRFRHPVLAVLLHRRAYSFLDFQQSRGLRTGQTRR